MFRTVGDPVPFVDGYGLQFSPQFHLDAIRFGLLIYGKPEPPKPHVEPEWKDRPAGFRHCVPLFVDEEQGRNHWA